MKKLASIFLTLMLSSVLVFAEDLDLSSYFQGKNACFILYDLNQDKIISEYNAKHCAERMSPNSTFKVPLSVMAFDQKIINQKTVFKWDGKVSEHARWNQDQTPQSWLKNSVVWISQELTPKLGKEKIQFYLKEFNYGNQDFSGDPGKNNGLTRAWLNSSLKISAYEQLQFLKQLTMGTLPVSSSALLLTKSNMRLEKLGSGWELYGKTGSSFKQTHEQQLANPNKAIHDGWFIGFIEKGNKTDLIVLDFTDLEPQPVTEFAGPRAKNLAKTILNQTGIIR